MAQPNYVFTQDDQMSPIYCIGCRSHIPRAVSNANGGYCPPCLVQQQAQQAAHQQAAMVQQQALAAQQAQHQAAQQARAAQLFHTQTGMGLCPQCHSPNVVQVANQVANGTRAALSSAGCLLMVVSLCCFWPLAIVGLVLVIVGMCLPATNQTGTSRICNYCGNRWLV